MEVRVSIETEPLVDGLATEGSEWEALVDAVLERLEADAATIGSVGFGRGGTLGAVFIVRTASVADAARAAVEVFERAVGTAGASAPFLRLELELAEEIGD